MRCFVIYAHLNPFSFNHAIKEEVERLLKELGHEVKVSDLYEMDFKAVLKPEDINLMYSGTTAADVKAEQEKITWAERLILVYPIWWTGFPAILKGYIDRVFSYGFAYSFDEKGRIQLLKGKKALLISTHGQPEAVYHDRMYTSLRDTQDVGVFEFCGIAAQHVFFSGVMNSPDELRQDYLNSLKDAIAKL
jgi:Putative NADPH-quinone reductase (modulator of drug activity B)